MVIERIETPADVKKLSREELDVLANEIRELLVITCARNGGHLAPNLGVVELTIALHRVLDLPSDKLRVGRLASSLRPQDADRPARPVPHAAQGRRHLGLRDAERIASTISSARATHRRRSRRPTAWRSARDLRRRQGNRSSRYIGDGALTGGLAYEAINNAGQLKSNFIVILNDNEMSIAPNVGSIASYLSVLRSKPFADLRARTRQGRVRARALRRRGTQSVRQRRDGRDAFRRAVRKSGGDLRGDGLPLHGPVRRPQHRRDDRRARNRQAYRSSGAAARAHASKAKATSRPRTTRARSTASRRVRRRERQARDQARRAPDVRRRVRRRADRNSPRRNPRADRRSRPRCPTAPSSRSSPRRFPTRFFDVGIAEAHAVCMAAGAASNGLQAGLRDLLDLLAARLRSGRARRVRAESPGRVRDGPGRLRRRRRSDAHGPLRHRLSAHAAEHDGDGAAQRRRSAADARRTRSSSNGPVAIRYPRGSTSGRHRDPLAPIEYGKAEVLRAAAASRSSRWATRSTSRSTRTHCSTSGEFGRSDRLPTVVNARFAKPRRRGAPRRAGGQTIT